MTRVAAVALLTALLLTGCSVDEEVHGGYIDGPKPGSKVWCVTSGYGVDCDFQNHRKGDR